MRDLILKGGGGWKTDVYSCLFSDDGPHATLPGFREEYLKHNSFRENFPSINIRITDVVWIFQISLKITCVRLGVYYHDLALHVCQYFWGKQNYIQVSFSPCMKRHILLWNSLKVRTPKGWTHTSFFPPWNGLNKIAPSLQTQILKGKSFALLLGEELCISGLLLATSTCYMYSKEGWDISVCVITSITVFLP